MLRVSEGAGVRVRGQCVGGGGGGDDLWGKWGSCCISGPMLVLWLLVWTASDSHLMKAARQKYGYLLLGLHSLV